MLNKKQKKQLDVLKKKQSQLQRQLSGARKQLDDPAEVVRLEGELASVGQQIRAIQSEA